MKQILLLNIIIISIDFTINKKLIKSTYFDLDKNNRFYNNYIYRNRYLTNDEKQKLNNIINIFNPYDQVSFISCVKTENDNLFIITNSENKSDNRRLLYGLKSDGSHYLFINGKSYIIMSVDIEAYNKYPRITYLKTENKTFLISISHDGNFESFDYEEGFAYSRYTSVALTYTSSINKNTFISLKYYNNSNYIFNTYIGKHNNS